MLIAAACGGDDDAAEDIGTSDPNVEDTTTAGDTSDAADDGTADVQTADDQTADDQTADDQTADDQTADDQTADDQTAATSDDAADDDGAPETLRVHLNADISNVDPAINPGSTNTWVALNVFENLVAYHPTENELVNELAETFEASEDGLRYDFKLKEGIQFHGGYGEVTAEDVKFSFERIAGLTDPPIESSYASDWEALAEVQVHDTYSGTIVLKEPSVTVLATTLPFGSGRIVSKAAVEERGEDFGTNPIGTGPYEWVEWQRNQSVTLQKFADYGGARDEIAEAHYDTIEFVVIDDANSALIALETDELDFAVLSPDTLDAAEQLDGFEVDQYTTLRYNWLGMNTEHPNFQDPNVRQAVIHGVDVESILIAAFDGEWTRATGVVAPGMPLGYWADAPVYERDVDRAREFLEAADAVGMEIDMQVNSGIEGGEIVAQVVQDNLNEVGFEVNVDVQDGGVFNQATPEANADKQLYYMSFGTRPDPSWSTVWFTCDQVGVWNWMSWCNEEYDQLHQEGLTESDPDRRHEIYVEMQRIMDEAQAALWVAHPTASYATRSGIEPAIRPDGEVIAWAFQPAN